MQKSEKQILALQKKVAKQTEKLKNEIYSICETLDYKNSSRFSYNIDRLEQFNNDLQNFKITTMQTNNTEAQNITTITERIESNK